MADATAARRNLLTRSEAAHRRAITETVRILERDAPKDTRQLSRSIRSTQQSTSAGVITSTVYVDRPRNPADPDNRAVAAFNEYGTRPHVIRPRRAKVLRWQQGGQVRFARKVNHPGTPARPWFYPVLRRWGDTLRRSFR